MNQIEVIGVEGVKERLDKLSTDRNLGKDLQKIIRDAIGKARAELSKEARQTITHDPRSAYKAVRNSVYKRIFGGQVNILSRKKNNGKMYVGEKNRTLKEGQRGGNRMKVSERTKQLEGYYGSDRGFILRFLNAGAYDRNAGTRHHAMKSANRGSITARNWFGPASQQSMNKAAELIEQNIDKAIAELWNS